MNLSDYRTRLSDLYGSELASDTAFYNRIINDSYTELAAMADWWWLETRQVLRFAAPVTSISVVAVGSTAQVFASTTADVVTTAYAFGYLSTGNYTYRVTTVNPASPYALTLDANWLEGSATFTCQVWNDTMELPSDFNQVVSVSPRNDPNQKLLAHVDLENLDAYGPDTTSLSTEIADRFAIYRETAYHSSTLVMRIFPPPDEVAEYTVRYLQTPATMSTDTASTFVPARHEPVLVAWATVKLLKMTREDPDLVSSWHEELVAGLNRMLRDQDQRGALVKSVKGRGVSTSPPMAFRLVNVTAGGI